MNLWITVVCFFPQERKKKETHCITEFFQTGLVIVFGYPGTENKIINGKKSCDMHRFLTKLGFELPFLLKTLNSSLV